MRTICGKSINPTDGNNEPGPAALSAANGNGALAAALAELRHEIVGGLLYTHSRANANTSRMLEAASFLYALVELLAEKGIITVEELDARKDVVAPRVEKRYISKGMGVDLLVTQQDKYALAGGCQIDCENRIDICQAACCRLWFPLSRQDLDEGIIQWDLQFPYIIAQDAGCYCRHLDRDTCRCSVYQHRPLPCRSYNCASDSRIWLDFDRKVINSDLEAMFAGTEMPAMQSGARLTEEQAHECG
jgi:hypothetical protein